ncbi:MAG: TIGR01777 family oxidoreductase [Planctomycetota bacterium]
MKVLIAGATGFVGTHLTNFLRRAGHDTEVVSRRPHLGIDWDPDALRAGVECVDAVVHLAGAGIFDRRWSQAYRREILESRVDTTCMLAEACVAVGGRRLVSSSAVGYYGARDMTEVGEDEPAGDDFLAGVCAAWERALDPAREAGSSTVCVRIGVVLGSDGGALLRMKLPFRLGLGGALGSGRQPFSWVHVTDLCRLFLVLLEHPELEGAFNGVAPGCVEQREFARILGKVLHRPAFLHTPGVALRLALGGVAEVLLSGQNAVPRRALEAGFVFEYPELRGALESLVGEKAEVVRVPKRPRGGV